MTSGGMTSGGPAMDATVAEEATASTREKEEAEEAFIERWRGVTSGVGGGAWLRRYAKNEGGNDPNSKHGPMEHLHSL